MTLTLTQRLSVVSAALLWASLACATTPKDPSDEVYLYNHYSQQFLCTDSAGHITESPEPSQCEWVMTDVFSHEAHPRYTFTVPDYPDHYLAVNTIYGPGHRLMLETPQTTAHPLHDWEAIWVSPQIGDYQSGILSVGHPGEPLHRYFLTYNPGSAIPDRHFQALTLAELGMWHIGMEKRVFDILPVDPTRHTA